MIEFYKIENGIAVIGSGEILPEGYNKFTIGNEPLELQEALEKEQVEQELQTKLQEANQYLKDTDWVKSYLLEHKLGLNILPDDSDKLVIASKRDEKIEFIKNNS